MITVFTANRGSVRLAAPLGRGGEATVYRVEGRDGLAAKIYDRPRPEASEKLGFMRASPPSDPTRAHGHAAIAWPQELLFDRDRRLMGYLMPYIRDAVPIIEVFNPRRRAKVLPAFNLAYLHRTARNLASALAALHARGYIVGDLNERNILVTPRALVTLIDTDSFQVEQPGPGKITTYPCPVGRLEYTPPELQGQAFRGLRRDTEHDAFGLGVLVFQLLMAGNHPFRGQWLSEDEPPAVETKIAEGWFPWSASAAEIVAPPPGAPDPATVHPAVAALFLRCFVDGHHQPRLRPPADEWAEVLLVAEQALVLCKNGHCFSNHQRRCPQCEAKADREAMPREATPPPRQTAAAPTGVAGGWSRVPVAGGIVRPGAAATGVLDRVFGSFGRVSVNGRTAARPAATRPAGTRPASRSGSSGALTPRPAKASLRWLRQSLSWMVLLAVIGAAAAVTTGSFVAALFQPLLEPPVAYAATPAGLWAAVIGGVTLTAAGFFRGLEQATDYRLSAPLLRSSLIRGGSGLAGWVTGWVATGAVFSVLGLATPAPTAFAMSFGSQPVDALAGALGWTLSWVIYGTIAGALGGALGENPKRWAAVAAVFGAAGWLAVRVAASLWVGAS
jgi:hypothetical protein